MKKTNARVVRSRKFCLISYIDRTALEKFLTSAVWVQHWALCSHDRDVKEDGTPKEFHTHILLYTYDAKTASSVKKIFDRYSAEIYQNEDMEAQNTLCQVMNDVAYQWRYLVHKDNPDKAQYEEVERICDNYAYWLNACQSQGMTASDSNSGLSMVEDMLAGTKTIEMVRRYGREYIYHSHMLEKTCHNIIRDELRADVDNGNMNMLDFFPLLLENAPLKKEDIQIFFNVLDYIRSECIITYNSKINIYLDELEAPKKGK